MTTLMGFAMHYYQHHIGDFIKDTSFLTNEEVGIYMKMIWIYYDTEEPIPNSLTELSMRVNARGKEDLIKGLLDLFFISSTQGWHHKRCDKEIEHYRQQLEFASKAGKASAAKRALNKTLSGFKQESNDRSTTVQPTNNQQPLTNNQKKNKFVVVKPENIPEKLWDDFLELRKSKKAPLTERAWNAILRESKKAGLTLEAALEEICERTWVSFKAEWVTKKVAQSTASAYGDRASV
jgi:uncharacterized protein YdaU (DUF1376 family)